MLFGFCILQFLQESTFNTSGKKARAARQQHAVCWACSLMKAEIRSHVLHGLSWANERIGARQDYVIGLGAVFCAAGSCPKPGCGALTCLGKKGSAGMSNTKVRKYCSWKSCALWPQKAQTLPKKEGMVPRRHMILTRKAFSPSRDGYCTATLCQVHIICLAFFSLLHHAAISASGANCCRKPRGSTRVGCIQGRLTSG